MELIRKHLYMNQQKCRSSLQITLDDDFNVPDSKPDIARLLKTDGEIKILEKKQMNGKLMITGALAFRALYISEDSSCPINTLQGELPFTESINLSEECSTENLIVSWEFEDLSAGIIHSRKFTLRSLVLLTILSDELRSHEAAVDINGSPDIFCRKKLLPFTGITVSRRDNCRLREDITLPNAKPPIGSVLYYELRPYNLDFRLMTDKFTLTGDLAVFVCYLPENGTQTPEYYETELPVSAAIDCPGCLDSMIPYILAHPVSRSLEVKPDADGEERLLEAELLLELSIRLYEEQELNLICDLYSVQEVLEPVFTPVNYESLLQRNNSRMRLTGQAEVPSTLPKLMQVCHASGSAKLDSITTNEQGLLAEGVYEADIFYVSAEDVSPLEVLHTVLPFTHLIEIHAMSPDCIYEVHVTPEQMSTVMIEQNTLELKASLNFDAIVFRKQSEPFLQEVNTVPQDPAALQSLPSICAYAVKPEDTLWDIAKHYRTTEAALREVNELGVEPPTPGELLLIMKEEMAFQS